MVTATKNTVENKISIHLTLNDFIVHSLVNAAIAWLYCGHLMMVIVNGGRLANKSYGEVVWGEGEGGRGK